MLTRHHRRKILPAAAAVVASLAASTALSAQQAPNVVLINIDDMGWGDFGVYGSQYAQTPSIDALAGAGTRFTQFYASAPICSPSRAGMLTGQFSARNNINSFLDNSASNLARDNANSLSLDAPSMGRIFQNGGYATGHFGKWHLGGGRDVGYETNPSPSTNVTAPRIVEYGFDEAWTQFEGLGNRIINVQDYGGDKNGSPTRPSNYLNGLNSASDALGDGGGLDQRVYLEREYNGAFMIDRAIEFVDDSRANNTPFFMNFWPDEVHTPHDPPPALKAKYDNLYPELPQVTRNYLAVLEGLDAQVGRLVDYVDSVGLGENTIFLVTADNGAEGINASWVGSNGEFRGDKGDFWEGGIREPLVVRWTGNVAAGQVNTETVMAMTDLLPTLASMTGTALPTGLNLDGEDLSAALLGDSSFQRNGDLFWNGNRGTENRHGNGGNEVVALRRDDFKLIMDADGRSVEFYDLENDPRETTNLKNDFPQEVASMAQRALEIRYATPARRLPDTSTPVGLLRVSNIAAADGSNVGSWSDAAGGDGVNFALSQSNVDNQPTFRDNALNGRPVLSFDGNDVLQSVSNLSLDGDGVTIVAVVTGDFTGDAAQRLGQLGDNTGTPGETVAFDVSTSSTDDPNGGAGFRFNNGANLYDTPLDQQFHIVVWQIGEGDTYDQAKLFVDGTTADNLFTGESNQPGKMLSLLGSDLQLTLGTGELDDSLLAGDYFTGELAEFLVYDEQLTIGQLNLVGNYLSTEYDLPFAYDLSFIAVPEPASVAGLSLLSLLLLRRR